MKCNSLVCVSVLSKKENVAEEDFNPNFYQNNVVHTSANVRKIQASFH